jgi:hypothetical protein
MTGDGIAAASRVSKAAGQGEDIRLRPSGDAAALDSSAR